MIADEIVEVIRRIGVKAGVASEVYGAMCHEIRALIAPSLEREVELVRASVKFPSTR